MNWKPISQRPTQNSSQLLGWVNVGRGSVAYIIWFQDGEWGGFPKHCKLTHWCEIIKP